jgi:predicted nucleotidyltransferase
MEINIKQEIKLISKKYSNYKFNLFGSFLNNEKVYGDIDILILYETPEFIKHIRNDFQNIDSHEIFHLMFLSNEEEKEIKFVEKVRAKEV